MLVKKYDKNAMPFEGVGFQAVAEKNSYPRESEA
jgi:hypothetical protein